MSKTVQTEDSLEEVWKEVQRFLYREFPQDTELWLNEIKLHSTREDKKNTNKCFLFLSVPNEFYKEKFEERYQKAIQKFVRSHLNREIQLEILYDLEDSEPSNTEQVLQILQTNSSHPHIPKSIRKEPWKLGMDPKHLFQNFVMGSSNRVAYAAGLRITEALGLEYNPFFLYGGVGLGKTHLMQAIGNKVLKENSLLEISYITSEQFANEYILSLKKGLVHNFRLKYRNSDLLLVDDIQFLEGKTGIQEELFHTFNMLKNSEKQMVFTSDRPPKELKTIVDRLLSRFTSGLITEIKVPDLEMRKIILKKKMQKTNVQLSEGILQFLAERLINNVRFIEAGVLKLKSIQELLGTPITKAVVQEELKEIFEIQNYTSNPSIEEIQRIVSDYYKISYEEIRSKKRGGLQITKPRQVAIYLAKELTEKTNAEIGREFGKRNHSTILSSYKKIHQEQSHIESTQNDIQQLQKKLLKKESFLKPQKLRSKKH